MSEPPAQIRRESDVEYCADFLRVDSASGHSVLVFDDGTPGVLKLAEQIAAMLGPAGQDPLREGETMPTAAQSPEEQRIAGIRVAWEDSAVLVKHVDGSAVQLRCVESGIVAISASSFDLDTHNWRPVNQLQAFARQQLEKHGKDRYPTVSEQLLKLVSEVGELADAWLKSGSAHDAFTSELADVALSLATLANKTGLDLVGLTRQLVEDDDRTFDIHNGGENT